VIVAAPPIALTAAPARIELAGAAEAAIRVANPSRSAIVVDAAPAGFALDLRGRPHIATGRDRSVRLVLRPRRFELPPGGVADVHVASSPAGPIRPGDHLGLVVLATRPSGHGGVAVRMRLGVVVVVRLPGVVVHRLSLKGLRIGRSAIAASLSNGGNVVEHARISIELRRAGRTIATLRSTAREILPGARGVLAFRRPPRIHGSLRAVVEVRNRGAIAARRVFRLRL